MYVIVLTSDSTEVAIPETNESKEYMGHSLMPKNFSVIH